MDTLCFATNNPNKIKEIRQLISDSFTIKSLEEIGCFDELPENQNTLEGNSLEKARYVFEKYFTPCFADDTGLEVDVLNGSPGVLSARYAGAHKSSADNIKLLLKNLEGSTVRKARFRTVITLVNEGGTIQFEGIVPGQILNAPKGSEGFGYDPVFVPDGYSRSFAELSLEEKNLISHRGMAFRKLIDYLKSYSRL